MHASRTSAMQSSEPPLATAAEYAALVWALEDDFRKKGKFDRRAWVKVRERLAGAPAAFSNTPEVSTAFALLHQIDHAFAPNQKNKQTVMTFYDVATKEHPAYAPALLMYARFLLNNREYDQALRQMAALHSVKKQTGQTLSASQWQLLAQIYDAKNEFCCVAACLDRAAEQEPQNTTLRDLFVAAAAFFEPSDIQEARRMVEQDLDTVANTTAKQLRASSGTAPII